MSMAAPTAIQQIDLLRASFLKGTLRSSVLRRIFVSRAQRLFFMFLGMLTLNLVLSVSIPLMVLVYGPIIYGLPHIFSSIRYVGRGEHKPKVINFLTSIFASVTIFRLLTDTNLISFEIENLEFYAFGITLAGLIFIYRRISLLNLVLAVLFLGAAFYAPIWITGLLILGHNFIAFIYWIAAAKSTAEKKASAFALLIFTAVNVLIFTGAFDFIYKFFTPAAEYIWADLNYEDLGKMIAPWSDDYITWFHCTVAYAFGQSMHYFVWMKAIPDQHHEHEVPTSFSQCWRKLFEDFGHRYMIGLLVAVVLMFLVWAFVSHPMARTIYFALAAYHGYMELAGLPFVKQA